jgi:hypothetical protein
MNKTIKAVLFILILPFFAKAQNVSYAKDTIYTDNQPYAVLRKTGTIFPNFSLVTLTGKEILTARYDKVGGIGKRYIITFSESGKKAYMRYDISFGKMLADEIVNSKLITNNDLNPDGEQRLLTAFPKP